MKEIDWSAHKAAFLKAKSGNRLGKYQSSTVPFHLAFSASLFCFSFHFCKNGGLGEIDCFTLRRGNDITEDFNRRLGCCWEDLLREFGGLTLKRVV